MLRDISLQSLFMGLLASFAGFASSFAVILQGLDAVGASRAEAASGLMMLALAMGLSGIFMAIVTREPISVAWTTPGAAFLAATGPVDGGFPVAVGAFLVCGIAITLSGLVRSVGKIASSIPAPLASAMLAGILLNLCLAPFKAIAFDPALGLPIVLAWAVVGAINRLMAVPAALLAFILVIYLAIDLPEGALTELAAAASPTLTWTTPEFTVASLISIAVPLYIITMASQNIPGIAIMKAYGYPLRPGLWFTTTGIASALSTPFGGIAVNLAAITAPMIAGEDAHEDKTRRYWAAIICGIGYSAFGLLAGLVTAFVSLAPAILIQAVAGLALIGAFSASAFAAFKDEKTREAAAVTFLITASGISIAGVSGAFWGLVAGGLMMAIKAMVSRAGNA